MVEDNPVNFRQQLIVIYEISTPTRSANLFKSTPDCCANRCNHKTFSESCSEYIKTIEPQTKRRKDGVSFVRKCHKNNKENGKAGAMMFYSTVN